MLIVTGVRGRSCEVMGLAALPEDRVPSSGAVGQVVPLYASVMNEGTVHRAIAGAEVVVNLVGALFEDRAAAMNQYLAGDLDMTDRIPPSQKDQLQQMVGSQLTRDLDVEG